MITSTNNAQVKQIMLLKKKARERKKQDVFLVEGPKMFGEAPRERLVKTYLAETFFQNHEKEIDLAGVDYEVVSDHVFEQMSDTLTPQGVLSIVRQYHYSADDFISGHRAPLLLVLEDLQDPGNVGTIFRTAEGAGVSGIIMTRNTVDIYNPKTIRSTMGSIYRVPFLIAESMEEILHWLRSADIRTCAAHLRGTSDYDQEDYTGGCAFFLGNEGNGLTEELSGQADCLVKIPMEGKLESLNVGIAAALLMYEASRQRRRQADTACI